MLDGEGVRVSRMISTVVLFMVTLVVGILFYRVMVGFFVPLFLAALLVVIFRPVHDWISRRLGQRRRMAALATTISILLVVLLPAVLVIGVAAAQGTSMISRVNYNSLAFALGRTREQLGLEIDNIDPFVRLPQLVQSLGEIESLNNTREIRLAQGKLREFEQVLRTLEIDFQPLNPAQEKEIEQTRWLLAQLQLKMQLLAEQDLLQRPTEKASNSAEVSTGEDSAAVSYDALAEPFEGVADESELPELEGSENSTSNSTSETTGAGAGAGAETAKAEFADAESIDNESIDAESNDESAEEDPAVDYRSPAEQFQRKLVELNDQASQLTTLLLGGPFRSQLKIWANPSETEISELINQAQQYLQPGLLRVTGATGEFLIQTVIGISILTIALYFFLVDGPDMVRTLMKLSPLDDRYEMRLLLEFDQTSRAVVLATVLSALAQGILAVFGYYFAGLGSIILLFLLTTFMAFIPFLGAAAIWLPCTVWLGLVEERWGAAIGLAIYGALVVSSIDNLIKVFVLHGRSQLHPLLALLSVLGGVQVFGPIGILVGPMVVVFLQSTLEILNHELAVYKTEESGPGKSRLALAGGSSVKADGDASSGGQRAETTAVQASSPQPEAGGQPRAGADSATAQTDAKANGTGRMRRKRRK